MRRTYRGQRGYAFGWGSESEVLEADAFIEALTGEYDEPGGAAASDLSADFSERDIAQADDFLEDLVGRPLRRTFVHDDIDDIDRDEGYEVDFFPDYSEQRAAAGQRPYLPPGGRNFVPQAGTFNCAPTPYTVIPASFLPRRTSNPNAAIDTALAAAGLNAAQRRRVTRAGLEPIAREFGGPALTELIARLRWSAAFIARGGWGRGADSMLVQRLLIHVPGHFRELARRAPNAREAFLLECLGWLLMTTLRDNVAAATRKRWWIPPAPGFVTAVPNPVPPASAEVQRLFTRYLYIDTLMTAGQWNARLNAWRNGLAGRHWRAEVFAARPGMPFYASLVRVPAHVNTAAVRANFATAWRRRRADVDASHAPHAAGAAVVTLAGLQNAVSLRRCDNNNHHLPRGTLSRLSLQGLELAYNFPMEVGALTIRRLTLLRQLHPVYTAVFRTIKKLGWNDLLYQTSGAACFRGVKHGAAQRVNIAGRRVLVNPFSGPNATTVNRINTHFTPAQRARVVRATRTARSLSEHGLGAAIDVNVPENGQGVAGRAFGSMDPRITAVFEAFHFRWGGCFRRTDPHHFEYCRAACAPAAVPATLAPGTPAAAPGGGALPVGVGPVIA